MHVMTGIVRAREHVVWVPKRKGALKSLGMSWFKPRLPAWQANALSIALCPPGLSCFIHQTMSFSYLSPTSESHSHLSLQICYNILYFINYQKFFQHCCSCHFKSFSFPFLTLFPLTLSFNPYIFPSLHSCLCLSVYYSVCYYRDK